MVRHKDALQALHDYTWLQDYIQNFHQHYKQHRTPYDLSWMVAFYRVSLQLKNNVYLFLILQFVYRIFNIAIYHVTYFAFH